MGKPADARDYDAIEDPYCYPGTTILKNIPDIRDQAALAAFEAVSTVQRSDEPLPNAGLSRVAASVLRDGAFGPSSGRGDGLASPGFPHPEEARRAVSKDEEIPPKPHAISLLPNGRLSLRHDRAIHHHLFQDVYAWAGAFRAVRIGKDGHAFSTPENIASEMKKLFSDLKRKRYLKGLSRHLFANATAHFLATLNAIRPFREGNGRTQTTFLLLLAERAGHPLKLDRLVPATFLAAMIESFQGGETPLAAELRRLIA